MSSSSIACDSPIKAALIGGTGSPRAESLCFIRSIAQKRLTAVGLVAASARRSQQLLGEGIVIRGANACAPSATPIAAVTPIAGAPRTFNSRMAMPRLDIAAVEKCNRLREAALVERRTAPSCHSTVGTMVDTCSGIYVAVQEEGAESRRNGRNE